jgi:hypothetical protein
MKMHKKLSKARSYRKHENAELASRSTNINQVIELPTYAEVQLKLSNKANIQPLNYLCLHSLTRHI